MVSLCPVPLILVAFYRAGRAASALPAEKIFAVLQTSVATASALQGRVGAAPHSAFLVFPGGPGEDFANVSILREDVPYPAAAERASADSYAR